MTAHTGGGGAHSVLVSLLILSRFDSGWVCCSNVAIVCVCVSQCSGGVCQFCQLRSATTAGQVLNAH